MPYTLYEQIRFGNFHPRYGDDVHQTAEARRQRRLSRRAEFCRLVLQKRVDEGADTVERCQDFLRQYDAADDSEPPRLESKSR
jgi:hypothetical protein